MTAYFIFVVLRTGRGGTTGFLRDKARQALEGCTKVRCEAMERVGSRGTPEAPHKGHGRQQKGKFDLEKKVPQKNSENSKLKLVPEENLEAYCRHHRHSMGKLLHRQEGTASGAGLPAGLGAGDGFRLTCQDQGKGLLP